MPDASAPPMPVVEARPPMPVAEASATTEARPPMPVAEARPLTPPAPAQGRVVQVVPPGAQVVTVVQPHLLIIEDHVLEVIPVGARPGGHWVTRRYCGNLSCCCGAVWALLFWPVSVCICLFKLDEDQVYETVNGDFLRNGKTAPPKRVCC
ncbi:hypothetical protein M885DRAFT_560013 [Pelagophyceae sp. CCMP2097]|nr:hypothetical protein M885DRAFT_560013 [Pelagophyceae sp. CCMP2097]